MWIAAIKREGWQPSSTSRVCSDHFIDKKSDDPLSPDYVPTQFKHVTTPQKRKKKEELEKFHRRALTKKRRKTEASKTEAAVTLLSLASSTLHTGKTDGQEYEEHQEHEDYQEHEQSDPSTCTHREVSVQTDINMRDLDNMFAECQSLRSEKFDLKEKLRKISFDEEALKDDKKVTVLTGLPSYETLLAVYNLICIVIKPTETLTVFQQLLITLFRLRFNMNILFLSFIYGVHTSTISRVFKNMLNALFARLVPTTVCWPDRDVLRNTMPTCFKRTFPKCVCIIDCFEIFIEKPSDLKARAQTYSNYKSHNTAKYLVGISPQGVITFISSGYGGRVSDKHITEKSGFLNNILPNDLVLADRGFDLKHIFGMYGAKLEIPAFTRGKKQLSATDVESSRKIASVRIHVERVIGLTRQKYTILESIIPITLLQKDSSCNMTTLDKIVHVCCALVNVCPSIVPLD